MSTTKIKNHPAAALLPMMDDLSYRKLKDDIKANGQQEPVVMFEGQILDGRHRWKACQGRFLTSRGGTPIELGRVCAIENPEGTFRTFIWPVEVRRVDYRVTTGLRPVLAYYRLANVH